MAFVATANKEEITEAIEEISQDPALFASILLDFTPYDYQKKFLREESKRIVVCAGRQVGKSTMAASRAIWFAVAHPRTTTLIVSATLRQSMNLFEKIVDFAERNSLVRNSIVRKTRTQLYFSNNSRIIALPCGPEGRSIRSYTAHLVIVDEAAFVTLGISDLHTSLHFKRVLVDSTGLGAPIVELCKEIGLPTAEMKFTPAKKEEILFNLKVLMEKKQITLPPDDNILLSSLNCIEAERTRTGGYSFDHPSGTQDDLAYALALAVWTAGKGDAKVIMMKQVHSFDKVQAVGHSWRESAGLNETCL